VKFCWSHTLLKSHSVKVTFFSSDILLKSHYVQVTFCWSHILLKSHSVKVAFCSSDILFKWHSVQVKFCWSHSLLKSYSVKVTFFSSDILFKWHFVEVTFCWSHILLNSHSIQVTFCTSDILLKWQNLLILLQPVAMKFRINRTIHTSHFLPYQSQGSYHCSFRLAAGLSTLRPRFDPRAIRVWFSRQSGNGRGFSVEWYKFVLSVSFSCCSTLMRPSIESTV